MRDRSTIVAVWAVVVAARLAGAAVVVRTAQGRVAGTMETATDGRTFYAYRSIPFAAPPVGSLRLQAPRAGEAWQGVRDGSQDPTPCLQTPLVAVMTGARQVVGHEDCLYLNVFTPSEPGTESGGLPVMVFIHGGAFFSGSAADYQPHVLLNHDVVLVVLQYRVGVLGFLSTEDTVLPGNLGLQDQLMGLRWVQDNAATFGGDPTRVTIFGESAGAASIHYLLHSPLTEGLFAGAIMQSGSAVAPFARGDRPREVAVEVGRALGCDASDSHVLLQCLQEASAHDLAALYYNFSVLPTLPVVFGPRVDGVIVQEEPALSLLHPRRPSRPVLCGTTAHEGAILTALMLASGVAAGISSDGRLRAAAFGLKDGDKDPAGVSATVLHHYLAGEALSPSTAPQLTQMFGDRFFFVSQELMSRRLARVGPTFTYELTYRGQHSFTQLFQGLDLPAHWVSHVDDLFYLFTGGPLIQYFPLSSPDDLRMRNLMTKLWVNFAATGNPTPDDSLGFRWEPVSDPDDPQHLDLNLEPAMTPSSRQQMLDFWSSLPTKENLLMAPERVATTPSTTTRARDDL